MIIIYLEMREWGSGLLAVDSWACENCDLESETAEVATVAVAVVA